MSPNLNGIALFLYLFSILVTIAESAFSSGFTQFLTNTYGSGVHDLLARNDLGGRGSFGGTDHPSGTRTLTQPVVLVHGITNSAGTFADIRDRFQERGHPAGSVYATTYGDAGRTIAPMVDVKCSYIKQTRMLIQSVVAYSRRKVDVVGYSMGSPIARKAILGGRCVDTIEYLGPPLTGLVDTFVSVAGANHGSFLCILPFPGACNSINGLSCNSRLINDINSYGRYEGTYVFSIFSPGDDKVGVRSPCGGMTTSIPGQNAEFQQGGNHDQVLHNSFEMQRMLIDEHHP